MDTGGGPWILGHRGAPREAPENTLVSLRRALDLGLDGIEYDVHPCASGEAVLLHDDTLDRTTDHRGPVSELTLPQLAQVDAGGWFHKRFAGEPLPLLEEVLELPGSAPGDRPRHMLELKEPSLVSEVARQLRELPRPLPLHVASFERAVCLEARDLGLPAMLLALEADEGDRRFVRDERIRAYGVGPFGWDTRAGREVWDCERWAWSVDDPRDLWNACCRPLFGFNTNVPLRALGTRTLVALLAAEPRAEGAERRPLEVPALEVPLVTDARERGRHGEWSGRWSVELVARNPFGFPLEMALTTAVRGGAFDVEGLPRALELAPGEEQRLPVTLAGGSWSPGEDPVALARLKWGSGPGRRAGETLLDAPFERVRTARVGRSTLRLVLLSERPGERASSMTVRVRGEEVLASVEDAGGIEEPRALLRLGSRVVSGARGVRARLPEAFRDDPRGVPFSVGFEGLDPRGEGKVLRRWSGGLPAGLAGGAPGRLLVDRGDA